MWKESPLSLDPWSLSTRSPVFTGDIAANVNGAGSLDAQLARLQPDSRAGGSLPSLLMSP